AQAMVDPVVRGVIQLSSPQNLDLKEEAPSAQRALSPSVSASDVAFRLPPKRCAQKGDGGGGLTIQFRRLRQLHQSGPVFAFQAIPHPLPPWVWVCNPQNVDQPACCGGVFAFAADGDPVVQ